MFKDFVETVQSIFATQDFIPLHEPRFTGNEKKYVADTIESTFVSSVGSFVTQFEEHFTSLCKVSSAVAVVNGTAGIHAGLVGLEVGSEDEVITQPLSFVATANAIAHCGASPVFIDVESVSLALCPQKLSDWLNDHAVVKSGVCYNKMSKKRIAACVPMHTFGLVAFIEEICEVCDRYGIPVLEDAAEALGARLGSNQVGSVGHVGVFSFNGNKIVTTGGGGIIVTDAEHLGQSLKHLTTTAKQSHPWEYVHDQVGYNYRLPNINAALGCAQMEALDTFLESKRRLHQIYVEELSGFPFELVSERSGTKSNYWLNTVLLDDPDIRDPFLTATNQSGVMTRPAWQLLSDLPMYRDCATSNLDTARGLQRRIVNIPSSVIP